MPTLLVTGANRGLGLELVRQYAAAGWRVRELDVAYRPRVGRSKVTGTLRGTWHAVQDMRALLADPRLKAGAGR